MAHVEQFSTGATQLDRSSPTPLWSQLEKELRRRLDAGHFEQRFPTDRELMGIYGVSRHTARHAIGQLGADGIVRRARGIGTSLDRRTMARSLGALYSLQQVVEERGIDQHTKVLELGLVRDRHAAEKLGLQADAELVHLHRIRYGNQQPMAVDRVWMPADVARPLLEQEFTQTSLYDHLERSLGRRPNEGWEQIVPAVPTDEERAWLGLGDDDAVFSVQRLGTLDGKPVEWRLTSVRGDRFAVTSDWSAGQRTELRLEMVGDD
jgi:GntR family transcriptional regulator